MDEQEIYELFSEELEKYPVLSNKETTYLLYQYQKEHNQEAFEKLALHNLRLAVMVAKRYINRCKNMSLLDLIQENYFIMQKSIADFQVDKGCKLSTYICSTMIYSLQKKIDVEDSTICIPRAKMQNERKIYNYIDKYYKQNGKIPSPEEISSATKISLKQINEIQKLSLLNPLSLNLERIEDGIEEEIVDNIESPNNNITDWEQQKDILILLRSIHDYLNAREYYILYNRIIKGLTLNEIGENLEISHEYVRKINEKSLKRLKPLLPKLQKRTIKACEISNIDTRELIPIDPKLRISLYTLRDVMDKLPYHIIYTKFCDERNDNLTYYQKCFTDESFYNIEETMRKIPKFINTFLIPENIDEIYNNAHKTLSVEKMLDLDIKPENIFPKDFSRPLSYQSENLQSILKELENKNPPYLKKMEVK